MNVASRLETAAMPGGVLVSEPAYLRLRDRFSIRRLDQVVLKGIGPTTVFLLQGLRDQSEPTHDTRAGSPA